MLHRLATFAAALLLAACGDALVRPAGPYDAPGQRLAVERLDVSERVACGISEGGAASCWGILPIGFSWIDAGVAARTVRDAMALDTGGDTLCAATSEGEVRCTDDELTLPPGPAVEAIAVGDAHVCAIRSGGAIECVGDPRSAPERFAVDGDQRDQNAKSIDAYAHRTCIIAEDEARCWGTTPTHGEAEERFDFPLPVRGTRGAQAVAVGRAHACVLIDAAVWCWGDNQSGAVGDPFADASPAPVQVDLPFDATWIDATGDRSCAGDGARAYCWGDNRDGLLGDGSALPRRTPTPVAVFADAIRELAGGLHVTCARLQSGLVACFGFDGDGMTGGETPIDGAAPRRMAAWPRSTALALGDQHACVIDAGASLWCVGRNEEGQLADESRQSAALPVRSALAAEADTVRAGATGTCVTARSGAETCWGGPIPAPVEREVPVSDAEQVAHGPMHSCAIDGSGAVWCWGDDAFGRAAGAEGDAPVLVDFEASARTIAVSRDTSCAIDTEGSVWCWGRSAAIDGRAVHAPAAVRFLP